jgi:poly(A) polymerase
MDEKDLSILNDILSKYYNDSHESSNIKERIITELSTIVDQWMADIATTTKHPNFDFAELGYGLKVFGSYRLKTNSYDGDIDMLCIVPEFINR